MNTNNNGIAPQVFSSQCSCGNPIESGAIACEDCLLVLWVRRRCSCLGIEVPKNATIIQLRDALHNYDDYAAIVHTENGVAVRQVDNPVNEYKIGFTVYILRSIKAESEEAAIEWIKNEIYDCYNPTVGSVEDIGVDEIVEVHKLD